MRTWWPHGIAGEMKGLREAGYDFTRIRAAIMGTEFRLRNFVERNNLEDLETDWRIILKRYDVKVLSGFNWLSIRSTSELL